MANISAFKSQIVDGGARPNQFRVKLTFPAFVGAAGTGRALSLRGALEPALSGAVASMSGRTERHAGR